MQIVESDKFPVLWCKCLETKLTFYQRFYFIEEGVLDCKDSRVDMQTHKTVESRFHSHESDMEGSQPEHHTAEE